MEALLTYKFETPQGVMDVKMSEATQLVWLGPDFLQSRAWFQLRTALVLGLVAGLVVLAICRRGSPHTQE